MDGLARISRSTAWWLAWLACGAPDAIAQLRPLDPVLWDVFEGVGVHVELGGGVYGGQRASLTGTEGRLVEIGRFRASWGLGRVAIDLAGTALRWYEERSTFAAPLEGVESSPNHRRADVGDVRVSTQVALTGPGAPVSLGLRFGVRLPTTDDLQGLERDRTDFFSTAAARVDHGRVRIGGELGLGVNGTRDPRNEQVDVLLFGLRGEVDLGEVRALLAATGQHDTRAGTEFRGNEDLGEARVGVRVGERKWISASLVRGWTRVSPDLGLMVAIGRRF